MRTFAAGSLRTYLLSAVTLGLTSPGLAQQDAHSGKWALNVAKSVYQPGPPPRGQTRIYTRDGNGFKVVVETIQPLGGKTVIEYTASFDGKDYPLSGNADADSITLTRIDDWTFDATLKRRGTVVTTARNTVSKDGATMTITAKGTTARGQPTSSVALYRRQ